MANLQEACSPGFITAWQNFRLNSSEVGFSFGELRNELFQKQRKKNFDSFISRLTFIQVYCQLHTFSQPYFQIESSLDFLVGQLII